MLPLDPFDSLWYPSVCTGTPMVPVRPTRHVFFARPRVVPCGLRVHVLLRLPVTRSPARCSCLPARDERRDSLACTPTLLALLANSARTPGERLPCHLDLTVICTLLSHRTVLDVLEPQVEDSNAQEREDEFGAPRKRLERNLGEVGHLTRCAHRSRLPLPPRSCMTSL